jgi:LmbE family N-acetylglucosaminyl deacetylase
VTSLLETLAAGGEVREPVALVVAHPDDEVIGLGSRLHCFADLTLIHLTDGAPRDGRDAERAGFADRRAYAAARESELQAALSRLGVVPKRIGYGVPDQETAHNLADLTGRLRTDLAGVSAVFTHPYEHGHPDHDSAALAVRLAAPELPRFEMAFYHLAPDGAQFGRFWPDRSSPEKVIALPPDEQARKAEALQCFATQAGTLGQFGVANERIRRAPPYDFSRPAPPIRALFEQWGFAESASDWLRHARAMLEPACAA